MTLPDDTEPGQRFDNDHHPRQRKSDQGLSYWGGWLYRHLVPAIAIAVAALAVANTQGKVDRAELKAEQAKVAAIRQQEGRAIAIDFLCGYGNGVADAGRRALAGKLEGQRGSGLPQEAQDDYVAILNQRLIQQVGVKAADVQITRGPDAGLVDCDKLGVRAKAAHP